MTKPSTKLVRLPAGAPATDIPRLSPRSQRLWTRLHEERNAEGHRRKFSLVGEELLHRGLEHFDLAAELRTLAKEAGYATKDGRALLSTARDAEVTGLKLVVATGISKLDLARRRAGRPSDDEWSSTRETAL
jgi:hypothetical protein